jgi:hypothetical protein
MAVTQAAVVGEQSQGAPCVCGRYGIATPFTPSELILLSVGW